MPSISVTSSATITGGVSAQASAVLLAPGGVAEHGVGEPGVFAEPSTQAFATADVSVRPLELALPATGQVQCAGMEIRVNNVAIDGDDLVGARSVKRSRRTNIESNAQFGVALREWGVSPLGDPFAVLGSPTGKKNIDIFGVYEDQDDGTLYYFPLMSRGIAASPERESDPEAGHFERYNVLGPGTRIQRTPVTIIFPPGHNLTRDQMVKKILTQAGETHFALEECNHALKEKQLLDADPISASQEIIDIEGRGLRWDRNGDAVVPHFYQSPPAYALEVDEDDILAISTVRVEQPTDVVTSVTVTGTQQLPAKTGEGEKTPPCLRVDTFRNFAIWRATYLQTYFTGALSPSGAPTTTTRIQIAHRVETCRTYRDAVLIREQVRTFFYNDPEAARYFWDAGSHAWKATASVYLAAGAAPGDDNIAHRDPQDKWTLMDYQDTHHFYDLPTWANGVYSLVLGSEPWLDLFSSSQSGIYAGARTNDGAYLGSVTDRYGWGIRRTAMKASVPGQTYEDTEPRNGVKKLGGGEAVLDSAYSYRHIGRSANLVFGTADGYKQREEAWEYGYAIVPGGTNYQFTDGTLSNEPDEHMQLTSEVQTTYLPTDENIYKKVVSATPLGGNTVTVVSDEPGAPPAIDYLPGYLPAQDTNQLTADEISNKVEAHRGETQPIKVFYEVTDAVILDNHLPRIVKVDMPDAENVDELTDVAIDIIRESMITKINVELSAVFLIAEGDFIRLTHHPAGIVDRYCIVNDIEWHDAGGPRDPLTTSLELELYPDG